MPRRSVLVALLCLLGPAIAEGEQFDLSDPPKSMRAKPYRVKGMQAWEAALPVWDKVKESVKARRRRKPKEGEEEEKFDRETLVATITHIEEAVLNFERSLHHEWNADLNRTEAEAVEAWFILRGKLPPAPEPADEKAREKAEKAAEKERKDRLRDLRKFIMAYGRAHRYENQFRLCDRCQGRKELRSPFGDRRPCTRCERKGVLGSWKGLLKARWHFYSPHYRMNPRRQAHVNRIVRSARHNPKRAAPFIATIAIDGPIEDHDVWVKVNTKQKVRPLADSKRTEKAKESYFLYRVGRVWFLYSLRHDAKLLEIPELTEGK